MDANRDSSRSRWLPVLALAVAVLALVVAAVALVGDDDADDTDDTAPATTTTEPTTTSGSPSSTVGPEAQDSTAVVFPDVSTSRRFDDPEAAARAFAVELLGFVDPTLGSFAQGDNRSGEVEVRSFAGGSVTTVLLRQFEDDSWFVLGAAADSIRVDEPAAGATLASPVALSGAAHAFEGNVVVHLFADGVAEPIGVSYVTGSGDGTLGEFEGEMSFEVPARAMHGTLVLFEPSANDGSTLAASVIRVHF